MTDRFILAATSAAELETVPMQAGEAVKAARFWIGKGAPTRKADALAAIVAAMRDRAHATELIAGMRVEERTTLAVVERYGGTVEGWLLRMELLTRGVIADVARERNRLARTYDPVEPLRERLLLVNAAGSYESFSSWIEPFEYPQLTLAAPVRGIVAPAGPPPWKSLPSLTPRVVPAAGERRATTEWMLELEQVASALASFGRLKLNRDGGFPATLRARVAKVVPGLAGSIGPLDVVHPIDLAFSVLVDLSVIVTARDDTASVAIDRLHRHLADPPVVVARAWITAWLSTTRWMDGGGSTSGSRSSDCAGLDHQLRTGRRLVAWALARAAAHGAGWLELEPFLVDLHASAGKIGSLYTLHSSWDPKLDGARDKDKLTGGPERSLAYWLDSTGAWCANAILITLYQFGFVERASSANSWAFRLTEEGRLAFGATAAAATEALAAAPARCLTIQPNFDVLLYTDAAASGAVIATLSRLGEATAGGGVVRTYRLTRASVCRALDSGITLEAALAMLAAESRTPVPANVVQSMTDWARKRDTLVLRRGSFAAPAAMPFTVDEDGTVSVRPDMRLDLVSRARLGKLAAASADNSFVISKRSVARAREVGLSSAVALAWLGGDTAVPPLLSVALERWFAPARGPSQAGVALGSLVVLRVEDAKIAHALRTSARVAPLLAGEIAPGWFVVHASERKRAEAVLDELGVDIATTLTAPPLLSSGAAAAHQVAEDQLKDVNKRVALVKRSRRVSGGHRSGSGSL